MSEKLEVEEAEKDVEKVDSNDHTIYTQSNESVLEHHPTTTKKETSEQNADKWYVSGCGINPVPDLEDDCGFFRFVDEACLGLLTSPRHTTDQHVATTKSLSPKEIDERRMAFGCDDETHGMDHSPIVSICGVGFQSPSQLKIALDEDPDMAKVMARDGGLPLHAICKKGMTFRYPPNEDLHQNPCQEKTLFEDILQEIREDAHNLKEIINIVLEANEDAALIPDCSGDLPVHMFVRQIWDWEPFFQLHFLTKNKKKISSDVFREVHFIHREIVQALLKPLATYRTVCRARGSQGTLLPIHIAALYGVKLDILQKILHSYDYGASVQCTDALDRLEPKLPIDLLQRHKPSNKNIILQSDQKPNPLTIFYQASDLIWAYNPDVLPHRNEPERLRRIEAFIRSCAMSDDEILPSQMQRAWVFFNTFTSDDESEACSDYSESVRNIIKGIDTGALCKLLQLQSSRISSSSSNFSGSGTEEILNILDIANPTCKSILEAYRDELYMEKMVIINEKNQSTLEKYECDSTNQDSSVKLFDRENFAPYMAHLCRIIFEIKNHDSFPSSFIILPYRLKQNINGGLELAFKKDADVAMKFAERLLDVSNAHVISHLLDEKKKDLYSSQDPDHDTAEENDSTEETIKKNISSFMDTFASSGTGYMYLLDEFKGIPVVNNKDGDDDQCDILYPIEVHNPTVIIPTILPLMQMGMALMRGKRGLTVLAEVILLKSLGILPDKLYNELKTLVGQFQTFDADSEKAQSLKKELLNFATLVYNSFDNNSQSREGNNRKQSSSQGSVSQSSCVEDIFWDYELNWLESLYNIHDERRSYTGLKKTTSPFGGNLWSQSENIFSTSEEQEIITNTSEISAEVTESVEPQHEETLDSAPLCTEAPPSPPISEGMLGSPSLVRPPVIQEEVPVNFDSTFQLHDYHSDDPPRNLFVVAGKDNVSEFSFSTSVGFSEQVTPHNDGITVDNESVTTDDSSDHSIKLEEDVVENTVSPPHNDGIAVDNESVTTDDSSDHSIKLEDVVENTVSPPPNTLVQTKGSAFLPVVKGKTQDAR